MENVLKTHFSMESTKTVVLACYIISKKHSVIFIAKVWPSRQIPINNSCIAIKDVARTVKGGGDTVESNNYDSRGVWIGHCCIAEVTTAWISIYGGAHHISTPFLRRLWRGMIASSFLNLFINGEPRLPRLPSLLVRPWSQYLSFSRHLV